MAVVGQDRGNVNHVYLNRIATSVPAHDSHKKFLDFAAAPDSGLIRDGKDRRMFGLLARRSQIEHRRSVLAPAPAIDRERLTDDEFYGGPSFASTASRMARYEREALPLAEPAVAEVLTGIAVDSVTHLIVTSCTGFMAPGLDLSLQKRFGLRTDLERALIGFMGCHAGITALKAAWHIVRSRPRARVLIVNLELCSLHLQSGADLEKALAYLQFADGCAASLVSAESFGFRLERFHCEVVPETADLIQWHIGDQGFEMFLSISVPRTLTCVLPQLVNGFLTENEVRDIRLWAVHPGGRAILDAVAEGLALRDVDLRHSRDVLREFGNMSSATIFFVLQRILGDAGIGGRGVAMAFGPGLTFEALRFQKL